MDYKRRIRDIREDRDLKQKEIAEVLGIRQNVYSRYETGFNEMPIRHLAELCKYYNLSGDYIMGLIDEPRPLYGRRI